MSFGDENQIRDNFRHISSREPSCGLFSVKLDLHAYARRELTPDQTIGSVLTVSGTLKEAYAATCKEYVTKFWPTTGPRIRDLLVASMQAKDPLPVPPNTLSADPHIGSIMVVVEKEIFVAVKGHKHVILEVSQVLQWFTATFRPYCKAWPCSKAKLQLSRPLYCYDESRWLFYIRAGNCSEDRRSAASCWHSMFEGFNLGVGFPTPTREEEKGVELPLDVMKALGLIWYPCHYNSKLFLKGDATALLPMPTSSNSGVQWHYLQASEEGHESLWDQIKGFGNMMIDLSTVPNFASMRMFVGYWPRVEIHLGTRGSEFQKVDLSGAEFHNKGRLRLGDEISGTLGTSGMGFFTAKISAKVMLPRTPRLRLLSAHERIRDKIRNSKKNSTLIYDLETKRAWLVPEVCVVLHLILAWESYQDQAEEVLKRLPYSDPDSQGAESAYKVLQSAMGTQLSKHLQTEGKTTFTHLVIDFFMRMSQIKDEQIGAETSKSGHLFGVEFREVAEFQTHVAFKKTAIDSTRSGGWLKLVTSKPDIVVLFCSKLLDPIRPVPDSQSCLTWDSIPPEQYYLTASMERVRHLSRQCGDGATLKLYNDLYYVPRDRNHTLLEISEKPPKEIHEYSDSGAIVIGRDSPKLTEEAPRKANQATKIDHKQPATDFDSEYSLHPVRSEQSGLRQPMLTPDYEMSGATCHRSGVSVVSQPTRSSIGTKSANASTSTTEDNEEFNELFFPQQQTPLGKKRPHITDDVHPGFP